HLPADYDLVLYGSATGVPASPLRSSPLRSSPLRSTGVPDTAAAGGTDATTPTPETLNDIPLRSSPLRSTSINRGTGNESVSTLVRPADFGGFDVQVSGFNGSSSPDPYILRTSVTPGITPLPCAALTSGSGGTIGSSPAPASVPATT